MGRPKEPYDKEIRGVVGGKVVVRQNKLLGTIWSSKPDMSQIIPTERQLAQRRLFARAQNCASKMLSNPDVKAYYKAMCEAGKRPHNILISELLSGKTPFPDDDGAQT